MKILDIHKHSHFSIFDALAKPADYAKEISCNPDLYHQVLCISEHGTLQGLFDTWEQAKKHNLKFMPACEFYFQETFNNKLPVYHLLTFTNNEQGYYELIDVNNKAVRKNQIIRGKIVITLEDIANTKHLYFAGACIGGFWNKAIEENDLPEAKRRFDLLVANLKGRVYAELQTFNGKAQKAVNETNIYLANKYNVPMIITSDAHVVKESDCKYINVARAMRFKMSLKQYEKKYSAEIHNTYLKSYKDYLSELENSGIDKKTLTRCVDNLNCIADSVEMFTIEKKQKF